MGYLAYEQVGRATGLYAGETTFGLPNPLCCFFEPLAPSKLFLLIQYSTTNPNS